MSQPIIARFNIQIEKSIAPDRMTELQTALYNAALWAASDDPEVFFIEKTQILGVSISVDDDRLSLIEAGATLGQCLTIYENFGESIGPTWFSIHSADGSIIDSPFEP